MLTPEPMIKLFAVAPKSTLSEVVDKLHKLKIAHFIEHKKDEFDICAPQDSFEKISSLLVSARSLMNTLGLKEGSGHRVNLKISDVEKNLEKIKSDVTEITDQRKKAEDEITTINTQIKVLKVMEKLKVSPEDFIDSEYVVAYLGTVQKSVAKDIENITENAMIKEQQDEKQTLLALFADAKEKEKIDEVLNGVGFVETDTAITKDLKGHAEVVMHTLEKRQEELQREADMASSKLQNIVNKHGETLTDIEKFLTKESEKGVAPVSFGSTKETFFLKCFVPKKKKDLVKLNLEEATNGKVYLSEEEITEDDEVPIKLQNGKYARNFEFFTDLYALPKYNEFDPTKLMAYTFPLFFGFMLGDFVYGLITFGLFYWLKKKIPDGAKFFNIMLAASISAMVFGIFYGEFFGFEPYHGPIVRTHDFNALMTIAIIAGLVQVNLGLILGFILEYKHHGLFHAISHKASWMILQVGGALFIGPLLGMLTVPQPLFYLGIGLFIVAAMLLFKAEGFIGIMEMPSILSHIVSYARLMAVGLASVFVAVIINQTATGIFQGGVIWMWPLGILVLVVGHTFNIALGILSPTLHSVRLHYVEFFTKFYQGGGIPYTPFGAEKEKSII